MKIKIDDNEINVSEGATILDAAGQAGIEIPTMCFLKSLEPSTTCMVCAVKIKGRESLAPSCGTPAEDGMVVETNTREVLEARKTAVDLLLSEHTGDCIAPCQRVCPFMIDIPAMIRCVGKSDLVGAREIIARSAVPESALCEKCKKPCESVCRRRVYDGSVSISLLMRYVLDHSSPAPEKRVSAEERENKSDFPSRIRKLSEEEIGVFLEHASKLEPVIPENTSKGYSGSEAAEESARCLRCGCGKKDACVLRSHAVTLDSKQALYPGERIPYTQHVFEEYIYEPGKCVKCGICVKISEKNGVPSGFTFYYRGFDTKVRVPFGLYENERLKKIISECVENCPTGALVYNKK